MNTPVFSGITLRDLLRSVGGTLFATAGLVLYFRREHLWGQGGLLLAVLVPLLVLLGAVLVGRTEPAGEPRLDAEPWQTVLMVIVLILFPIALARFLGWVGANTRASLIVALVLLLSGALAAAAARLIRVRYGALLGTLYVLIAWLALWDKIANHPSGNTVRWLLLGYAALATVVALLLTLRAAREASEVATGAGLAAVLSGFLGVIGGLVSRAAAAAGGVVSTPSLSGVGGLKQHFIWDLFLLAVSVSLIWYGSRARVRGPGYVGGLGLLLFLISVGSQVTAVQNGNAPSHSFVGWPLALLLIGLAVLVAGMLVGRGALPPPETLPPSETLPPPGAAPPP